MPTKKIVVEMSFITRLINFLKFAVALILSTLLPRFVTIAIGAGVMSMFVSPLVGFLAALTTVILLYQVTDYFNKLEATAIKFTNWMFRSILDWTSRRDVAKHEETLAKKDAAEAARSGVMLYIPDASGFLRPVSA